MGTKKGIVLRTLVWVHIVAVLIVAIGAGTSIADEPLLLVYPNKPTIFRYDPYRYELLPPQDPKFDHLYAISNGMLWDREESRIPYEIYRAPQLLGFEPSPYGMNEFVLLDNEFNIIIDGYSEFPRTYGNLYMRFIPVPEASVIQVYLQSQLINGLHVLLPDLAVSTPTGDGHFSDSMTRHIYWSGAAGIRIMVYSDKDNDGTYTGGKPLYSIFVEDNIVSTEETSWGAVKALYRD